VVRLRPIRVSDAELCFGWVSDPDVALHLGLTQAPRTVREERAWVMAVIGDRTQRVFMVMDARERPIGTVSLRGIDEWEGTARLGLMIGEKSLWDRGYGTAATKAALELAFAELHLREVRLSCHADNPRGLRCYGKAGFRVSHLDSPPEACPERSRRGEVIPARSRDFHPQVHMVITREQWEKAQGRTAAGAEE